MTYTQNTPISREPQQRAVRIDSGQFYPSTSQMAINQIDLSKVTAPAKIEKHQRLISIIEDKVRVASGSPDFRVSDLFASDLYFHGYLHSASYVCRFTESFGIEHNSDQLHQSTALFMVWLKAMDNLIDTERITPASLLKIMEAKSANKPIEFTADLYPEISMADALLVDLGDNRNSFLAALKTLTKSVEAEQQVRNLKELYTARNDCGEDTAKCMLEFVKPAFPEITPAFQNYMFKIGAVGNIADSAVDLKRDAKEGLIPFKVNWLSRVVFLTWASFDAVKLLITEPKLLPVARAVAAKMLVSHRFNLMSEST